MLLKNFRRRFLLELHEFLSVDEVVVWSIEVGELGVEDAFPDGRGVELSH